MSIPAQMLQQMQAIYALQNMGRNPGLSMNGVSSGSMMPQAAAAAPPMQMGGLPGGQMQGTSIAPQMVGQPIGNVARGAVAGMGGEAMWSPSHSYGPFQAGTLYPQSALGSAGPAAQGMLGQPAGQPLQQVMPGQGQNPYASRLLGLPGNPEWMTGGVGSIVPPEPRDPVSGLTQTEMNMYAPRPFNPADEAAGAQAFANATRGSGAGSAALPYQPQTTMNLSNAGNPNTGVTGGLPPSMPTPGGPSGSQAQVGATPTGAEPQGPPMQPSIQPQPAAPMATPTPGQPWGGLGVSGQRGPMGQNLMGMLFLRQLLGGQGMGGQWGGMNYFGGMPAMQNGPNSGLGGQGGGSGMYQGGGQAPNPIRQQFMAGMQMPQLPFGGGGGQRAGLPFTPQAQPAWQGPMTPGKTAWQPGMRPSG